MVKKLLCILLVMLALTPGMLAEHEESVTNVTLTIGEWVIPATLNDNEAARDLLSRLPYTVTVSRGSVDFCGDIGEPLAYDQSDYQQGWEYGDFMWMPDGNWFVIFTDGIETHRNGQWIVLGHMDKTWEQLKELRGSIDITIARAEKTNVNWTIFVTANGETRTAVLSDNASADAFLSLLQQGDVVINMHDYGGFEKVGELGCSIVRSDEDITTAPGDIILYLGENVTIYYDVNRWDFTLLGHIDGATGENMRAFLGDDPTVTFSAHE